MGYDKLVRDGIPAKIRRNEEEPVTHTADDEEYRRRLRDKLEEEVEEFLEDDDVEELADVLEVLQAIAAFKGVEWEEIERLKREKAEQRGGFEERIVLDGVE